MAWMTRAGKYGEESHAAWNKNVVTIGWIDLPDVSHKDRDEIRDLFEINYPHDWKSWSNWTGSVFSFVRLINISDLVVLPCKLEKSLIIGKIIGDYTYKDLGKDIIHFRRAEWLTPHIPRTELPAKTLKYFDRPPTVYELNPIAEKVVHKLITSHAKEVANNNNI